MATAKYFPEWEKMTVREIREYLAKRRSAIVPLGVTEQHGYHLPTGTDSVIAREFCKRVGARAGIIVAPTINMSFSGGQLPGTININPNVMGLLVGEVLRSLAVQGTRNMFVVLGHGGSENIRALDNTLKMLLRDDPAFHEVMICFAPYWRYMKECQEGYRNRDWHAGYVETSAMMAVAPELVQMDQLTMDAPGLAAQMRAHPDNYQFAMKPVDDPTVIARMSQRPELRVGVMGYPRKASRAFGERAVKAGVAKMARHFVLLERSRSRAYRKVRWTPEPIVL